MRIQDWGFNQRRCTLAFCSVLYTIGVLECRIGGFDFLDSPKGLGKPTSILSYIYAYICIYIYSYTYVCMYICICRYDILYTHTDKYIYIYTYRHAYPYPCIGISVFIDGYRVDCRQKQPRSSSRASSHSSALPAALMAAP